MKFRASRPPHPISPPLRRRTVLAGAAGTGVLWGLAAADAAADESTQLITELAGPVAELERQHRVSIGLFVRNLATGATISHRADERFPHCSVFKTWAVAALLADRRPHLRGVLDRGVHYAPGSLVPYSPFLIDCLERGVTPTGAEVCRATLQLSDNGAGNWVLAQLDGPAAATRFLRGLGDTTTRLDRWETELNTAIPGDLRDTSTPRAVAASYTRLLVGSGLRPSQRDRLRGWMLGNQTSDDRFRAGLPAGWTLADKTGTGAYGVANEAGIAWTPHGVGVALVALTKTDRPDAEPTPPEVHAELARITSAAVA